MDQPRGRKPGFDAGGFTIAALLAPGMALVICLLGTALTAFRLDDIGTLIGGLLFLSLIVSVWGVLPSALFGGLVLAVIQRIPRRERPTTMVFMMGGVVAAGLYVLSGLGIAGLSPGAAMFFAPWATPDLRGATASDDWWMVASLLLAGAGAGLIYAAFVKRG